VKLGALVGLAIVGAACTAAPLPLSSPPSEAAARAFLDTTVELASAGRFEELCAIGPSNCERFLDEAGRDAPSEPPTIVGTRIIQPQASGDAGIAGGMVLELCGRQGGEVYYSEMLIFREGGELKAIEPIYWSGMVVADDATVGGEFADDAARCVEAGFE
jgi:hypothetical protein